MNDPIVTQEPVATGWLRTELYGDPAVSGQYVRAARRYLGSLKSRYGVVERVAQGEPGGFYAQSLKQRDGVVIDISTNDGLDVIRISSPTSSGQGVHGAQLQGTSISAGVVGSSDSADFHHVERPDVPEFSQDEPVEEEIVAVEKGNYKPYLWVGVRQIDGPTGDGGDFLNQIHACIWEYASDGVSDPVILSNRNDFVSEDDPSSVYPLGPWTQTSPADSETGICYTDDKLFMLQEQNGLSMAAPGEEDSGDEWDVIFISDPDNDLALTTPDGPMEGTPAGGQYMVKVMMVGADCGEERFGTVTLEIRVITGKDADETDDTHTTTITQFTQYKMGIVPLGYFHPSEENPDTDPCSTCDEPVNDNGQNPHAPHWWQGAASIVLAPEQVDVPRNLLQPSIVEFTDDTTLPPTGFAPGAWWQHIDVCPACIGTSEAYYSIGYLAENPTRVIVDSPFPTCGAEIARVTKQEMHTYYLSAFVNAPIRTYVLNGQVSSATFTGQLSGGSKALVFSTTDPGDGLGFYSPTHSSASVREYPWRTAGTPFFGFCTGRTNELLADLAAEGNNADIIYEMSEGYASEHFGDDMTAYYKIVVESDESGITSDQVVFISKDEFDSIPSDEFGNRVVVTCSRGEQS